MPNVLYNGPGNWPDADKLMANYNYLENIATAYTTLRNRIINGDMRIDQRNEGAAVTVNAGGDIFSVDRWHGLGQPTDGAFTLQRVTTVPTGFVNALKATVTAADASIGASQIYGIRQKIEGSNIVDFCLGNTNSKYMTLSFWVQSSISGLHGGIIFNGDATRSYPFTYTINSANTYEFKTVTIPCDSTGTWAKDAGIGLQIMFSFGSGSSFIGSPFGWAGGAVYGVTGQTNLIATNGSTFYLTGVQLELGTVSTPFEILPMSTGLELCQRYYEKSYDQGTAAGTATTTGSVAFRANGTSHLHPISLKVVKRAQPTVVLYNTSTGGTGSWRDTDNNANRTAAADNIGYSNFRVALVSTVDTASMAGHFTASAEI